MVSVGCPWGIHRVPMLCPWVFPWGVRGFSMRCPWVSHGLSVRCWRWVQGTPMGCSWDFREVSWDVRVVGWLWGVRGVLVAYPCSVHEQPIRCPWDAREASMDDLWVARRYPSEPQVWVDHEKPMKYRCTTKKQYHSYVGFSSCCPQTHPIACTRAPYRHPLAAQ